MKNILRTYSKKHFSQLVFIFLVIILVTGISLLPPQILRVIIDEYLPSSPWASLVGIALVYFSSFLLINVLNFLKEWLLNIFAQGVIYESKMALLNKLHNISYNALSNLSSGQIESYFNNDVSAIDSLITNGIVSLIIDCVKIIGIIVSIFLFSLSFGWLTLALLPIILLIAFFMRKISFKQQLKMRKIEGDVNAKTLGILDNSVTIKAYGVYDEIASDYESTLQLHYEATKKTNFCDAIFAPLMQTLKTLAITILIILSTKNIVVGISLGTIAACIDYISDLFKPIDSLGMELTTMQKAFSGIKRISGFLALNEDEKKKDTTNLKCNIAMKDVSFSYDNEKWIVQNLSLSFVRNEKYVFIGSSGTGKSTLFKVLSGVVKPTLGQVLIDDSESYYLNDVERENTFSILFQTPFFLHKTLREEISLLNNSIDDSEIIDALNRVGLKDRTGSLDDICLPHKYSTGEQMLLNLARIIVNPHSIILIDELNSQIDKVTLTKIMKVIAELSRDRIVISISHYGMNLKNSHVFNLDDSKDII